MCTKRISNTVKPIFILLLSLLVLIGVVFADDNSPPMGSETETGITFQENDTESLEKIDLVKDVLIPFILQTLGAFGGFMSALALNNRESRAQSKELDSSLLDELFSIRDELKERIESQEEYLMFQYLTPAWDSSLASGILSAPSSRSVYKKYIKIYSQIKYAQELEREYTQSQIANSSHISAKNSGDGNFLEKYINLTDAERKKCAHNIYCDINKLLGEEEVS